MAPSTPATRAEPVVALKEWAAVAHALLDGRQTVLLRKGGIHEKAFALDHHGRFVLFPTVAHSHRERVRPEHLDVLASGEADVDDDAAAFTVRVGLTVVAAVAVRRPEGLERIEDLHIWTAESVRADRLDFRPKQALQAVVVKAIAIPPVTLPRLETYAGCRSWVDLPIAWGGVTGRAVHPDKRLEADAGRVSAAVG